MPLTKTGRKKLPPALKRSQVIQVRVTKQEEKDLKERAEFHNATVTSFIRILLGLEKTEPFL